VEAGVATWAEEEARGRKKMGAVGRRCGVRDGKGGKCKASAVLEQHSRVGAATARSGRAVGRMEKMRQG
jgi:hypothetical protein